ncbi:23S rRNA (pseudouridine1915-N3)-methyltransferase [Thermotomaculum hydrothermale]|uniref:Ribosomal RNA large subunit methyltransferase H n=1 Tax=Thermotomaculum hydrothermale TaxID=981385 RepID=A0A7R6PM15_9BACT|nr:23S rRNA (pseudouridine(1915)-N(3))-methyltransferase RlmH [Thermotomaculum hydrothermale]BBB32033.1 23S rRNA (pseudouridine1915-N3)-methyltransferase [Thermotomaculum hydrothermale]
MKIKFIWPGETKESCLSKLESNYIKKISRFIKCEKIVFKSRFNEEKSKQIAFEEGEIEKRCGNLNNLILLTEKGKEMDSFEFAKFLEKKLNFQSDDIVFAVGGENGFSENFFKKGMFLLSLSKMTFTHEFARIILLEQVYRAFTIIKNIKYQR